MERLKRTPFLLTTQGKAKGKNGGLFRENADITDLTSLRIR